MPLNTVIMNVSSKFMLLRDLAIFKGLDNKEIEQLADKTELKKVGKGKSIYKEDVTIDTVYVIFKGTVKLGIQVIGEREIIRGIIQPGEIFGENIFNSTKRLEYAVTLAECHVFCIPVTYYQELLKTNAEFRTSIVEQMMTNVSVLKKRIHNYMFYNAQRRILEFLKDLTHKTGTKLVNGEYLVNHNMNHLAIANSTDTSRQTVARVLNDLKSQALISYSDRRPSKIIVRPALFLS